MNYYSIKETAKILGVQVRTIREWIRKGIIIAQKYPQTKMWRISETEIERMKRFGE